MKLNTSTSFRAVPKCFSILCESLDIACKVPSYTSVLNWIHKIGYYQLNKIKEKADDWIIILYHNKSILSTLAHVIPHKIKS